MIIEFKTVIPKKKKSHMFIDLYIISFQLMDCIF